MDGYTGFAFRFEEAGRQSSLLRDVMLAVAY
jgi:hypothetical protein